MQEKNNVVSFIDKRLEKIKQAYLSGDLDMKQRIDRLVSSDRAMERLMEDLNMNEENRTKIRQLRESLEKDNKV